MCAPIWVRKANGAVGMRAELAVVKLGQANFSTYAQWVRKVSCFGWAGCAFEHKVDCGVLSLALGLMRFYGVAKWKGALCFGSVGSCHVETK